MRLVSVLGFTFSVFLLFSFMSGTAKAAFHTVLVIEQSDGRSSRRLEERANTGRGLIELSPERMVSACFIGEAGNVVSIMNQMARNTMASTGEEVFFRSLWAEKQDDVFVLRVKAEALGPQRLLSRLKIGDPALRGSRVIVDTTLFPCSRP